MFHDRQIDRQRERERRQRQRERERERERERRQHACSMSDQFLLSTIVNLSPTFHVNVKQWRQLKQVVGCTYTQVQEGSDEKLRGKVSWDQHCEPCCIQSKCFISEDNTVGYLIFVYNSVHYLFSFPFYLPACQPTVRDIKTAMLRPWELESVIYGGYSLLV